MIEVGKQSGLGHGNGYAYEQCPCQEFSTRQAICKTILLAGEDEKSQASVDRMIDWLSSSSSTTRSDNHKVHNGQPCPNRVRAAVWILNAIREGCRVCLESSAPPPMGKSISTDSIDGTSSPPPKIETYENTFPSLLSKANTNHNNASKVEPTLLVGRRKPKKKQALLAVENSDSSAGSGATTATLNNKTTGMRPNNNSVGNNLVPKRRIRPAPVAMMTTSPWNSSNNTAKGNISDLPSEDPWAIRITEKKNITQTNPTPTQLVPQKSLVIGSHDVFKTPNTANNVIPKRRIQPTHTAMAPSHLNGNIRDLPSKDPWPGMIGTNKTSKVNPITPVHTQLLPQKSLSDVHYAELKPATLAAKPLLKGNPLSAKLEKQCRARLVKMYSIILLKQLAPSTSMELHLLLRLLSVSDDLPAQIRSGSKGEFVNGKDKHDSFEVLFQQSVSCREFATQVFMEIETILCHLGHAMLQSLVKVPTFIELLPQLTIKLQNMLNDMEGNSDIHKGVMNSFLDGPGSSLGVMPGSTMTGNTNTPMLTVPFDQNRDSRHNYRTRQESAIYKNREETRDAFLYQLRAFQNVRGRVLSQTHRSINDIQAACRDIVIRNIFPINMTWFAQLFCDLLLQIGLVPLEETDKEVLSHISDKEKLKKLHRRFTSKGGQKNRSSQKLVLDQNNVKESANGNTPAISVTPPEQFFLGNQEFFFLFLRVVDSYNFGTQLSRRLVGLISDHMTVITTTTLDTNALEQRISKLRLLAKFLGVLVFSPNWILVADMDTTSGATNASTSSLSNETVSHLDASNPILPLQDYIDAGWRNSHISSVIPWVTDFLFMTQWDRIIEESKYYQDVFATLWSIHIRIGEQVHDTDQVVTYQGGYKTNMQLISFELETLFADVVGLSKAARLPHAMLPEQQIADVSSSKDSAFVDKDHCLFTKSYIFGICPLMEELHGLMLELTRTGGKLQGSSGTPRKMRPYAITSNLESVTEGTMRGAFGSNLEGDSSVLSNSGNQRPGSGKSGVRGKLVDAFFHQHKELQNICEIVVDQCIKNVATIITERCIRPHLVKNLEASNTNNGVTNKLSTGVLNAENGVFAVALAFMVETTEQVIRSSLNMLIPPLTNLKVKDIAITLAIEHCHRLGEAVVKKSIRHEVHRLEYDLKRRVEKQKKLAPTSIRKDESSVGKEVLKMLDLLKARNVDVSLTERNNRLSKMLNCYTATELSAGKIMISSDPEMQLSVNKLASTATDVIETILTPSHVNEHMDSSADIRLLLLTIEFIALLNETFYTPCGLDRIAFFLEEPGMFHSFLQSRVESDTLTEGTKKDPIAELGKVLVRMVTSKLINTTKLERSLLGTLGHTERAQAISLFCLHKLGNNNFDITQNRTGWIQGESLIMLRLRREVLKRGE